VALKLIYLMFSKLLGWMVWGSRTGYTPLTRGDRRPPAVGMIARPGAVRTGHGVAYDGLTPAGVCRVGSGI
jgi:hypothetical protein